MAIQLQNQYLDLLINPIFQDVNRLLLLQHLETLSSLALAQIKDYNVVIDGRQFFDQLVENNLITYDNIWKIATSQEDDYINGRLLDYNYFNDYYQLLLD